MGKKIGLAESVQAKIADLKEVDLLVGIPSFKSAKTIALIVLANGPFLGNFLGRAALIASVNAGVRLSSLLSKGVKTVIMLFALAMSLEQLGIGRSTVIAAFTVVFGGVVLAPALAFGLGGQDLARRLIEKRFKKEGDKDEERDELKHL